MKTEVVWKVDTVAGHMLEETLNELSREQSEVVHLDRTGTYWTVVTRRAEHPGVKNRTIGFTPQKAELRSVQDLSHDVHRLLL